MVNKKVLIVLFIFVIFFGCTRIYKVVEIDSINQINRVSEYKNLNKRIVMSRITYNFSQRNYVETLYWSRIYKNLYPKSKSIPLVQTYSIFSSLFRYSYISNNINDVYNNNMYIIETKSELNKALFIEPKNFKKYFMIILNTKTVDYRAFADTVNIIERILQNNLSKTDLSKLDYYRLFVANNKNYLHDNLYNTNISFKNFIEEVITNIEL